MTRTPEEIAASLKGLSMLLGALAENASHIAHIRKVMFDAYRAEGFTDEQALELCKVMGL